MKKTIAFLIFSLVLSVQVFSQSGADQTETLKSYVEFLASDKLKGRETGTKGEIKAARHIAKEFEKHGLAPKGENGGYFQEFSFKPKPNPHAPKEEQEKMKDQAPIEGRNVIGYIDNGAEHTVVIGAHYDHLGMGSEGSLHGGEKAVHNGADDNASGVAVTVLLAQSINGRSDLQNNNYLFIAFSGEEKGLWGSNYFTKHPTVPLDKVNYMINMDMVGRYREEKGLAINGTGTSPIWDKKIPLVNKDSIKIVSDEAGIGPSDHASFYTKNIPVLHFFTGQHEDYHKPSDDVDKVNFEGMLMVHGFILQLIAAVNWDGKLTYTRTAQENSRKAPQFSVTLGVMPDYMFSGEGMRIEGVIDDRPAQKAGIRTGDVVIKMGEVEVKDMHTYMKALGAFKKGDVAKVAVKRDDEKMEFDVQF